MLRQYVPVAIAAALAFACSSSGGDELDASSTADSGVHPDAVVAPADSGVHPDAAGNPDAPAPDVMLGDAPVIDAFVPDAAPDGGFLDAAAPDATPADTGPADAGACAPIPRASLCASLTAPIASYLARCNPELAPSEALALAGAVCSIPGTPFTDTSTSIAYAPAAAGACACEIERLPCNSSDPFLTIGSCMAVFTGTIAAGNTCRDDHRCAPGSYCSRPISETAPGPLTLGFRSPRCPGVCTPYTQPGDNCVINLETGETSRCVPSHACDLENSQSCVPRPQVGQSCANLICAGAESAVGPPTVECVPSTTSSTVTLCQPKGRLNASCGIQSCHPLYRCSPSFTCEARARPMQACTMRATTSSTTVQGRREALQEAREVCLNPLQFGITTGQLGAFTCVETAGTPGRGVCRPEPAIGQPCGIGPGVTPHCAAGGRCTVVNPTTFAPVSGTCMAAFAEGEICLRAWEDALLSPQCAGGAVCQQLPEEEVFRCQTLPMCFEIETI